MCLCVCVRVCASVIVCFLCVCVRVCMYMHAHDACVRFIALSLLFLIFCFLPDLGSDRSELQSVLQEKYSRKFQMLPTADLEAVYAGWLDAHVAVYLSERAGAGKSHTITRRISQLKLAYRKVSLHGAVSDAQFVRSFAPSSATASASAVGFHVLISSSCAVDINFQLYQLLIMGRLSADDLVVTRGTQNVYMLELTSGIHYQPLRHVSFCQHLPKVILTAHPLDPNNPLEVDDTRLREVGDLLCAYYRHRPTFDQHDVLSFKFNQPLTRETYVEVFQLALQSGSNNRRGNMAAESLVTLLNFVRLLHTNLSVLPVAGFFNRKFWDEPAACLWLRSHLLEKFVWQASWLSERAIAADARESHVTIAREHLWEQDNQLMVVFPKPPSGNMAEAGACRFLYRSLQLIPKDLQTIVTTQVWLGCVSACLCVRAEKCLHIPQLE